MTKYVEYEEKKYENTTKKYKNQIKLMQIFSFSF